MSMGRAIVTLQTDLIGALSGRWQFAGARGFPREFVEGWMIGKPDVAFSMPQELAVPAAMPKGGIPYQVSRRGFLDCGDIPEHFIPGVVPDAIPKRGL
jgi:hypothetical protein